MIFEYLDRIVFAGDSVTDMGSSQPVGEGLGDNMGFGYPRIVENFLNAWYPELRVRCTNSGISGNTSGDLINRFQRDVIDLNPQWVSINIGMNDVWRQFDSPALTDYAVNPELYEENVEKMIIESKKVAKGVIIMTPHYMEPNRADLMRARMDQYGDICRKLAEKHSCVFVDSQKALDDYFKYHHSSFISWDRIHPNQIGATVIARAFVEACGFDFSRRI